MSASISRPPAVLWHARGRRGGSRPLARASFVSMGDVSMSSRTPKGGDDDATLPELRVASPLPQVDPAGHSDLRFDRLQPPDPECNCRHKRVFGRFVAREALLEEEFWTAAWLRAESHWEDQPFVRHAESYKRMFAEKEFTAIKRRCNGQNAEQCTCIVVAKREEKHVKRTVLNSIVGTLDISIRFLLQGQTFPGMFVHVNKDNVPGKGLYEKLGFQIVEVTTAQEEQELMRLKC
ncbi:hypothetical protein Taro_046868 [Colocasia esculenta]|uniref:N-acetyltransferase domain-containing protein n=1 Tax=Colocasia esculenta TaxID=4460 RepID=A0A843X4Q0_COLES|nr:hypothetical protein [Colocasia esculenta]